MLNVIVMISSYYGQNTRLLSPNTLVMRSKRLMGGNWSVIVFFSLVANSWYKIRSIIHTFEDNKYYRRRYALKIALVLGMYLIEKAWQDRVSS